MAGASMIAIECDETRIYFRIRTKYVDYQAKTLDEAMELINKAIADGRVISVGLLGNADEVLPEMLKKGIKPDAVTDQTSAHDPLNGYLPIGWTVVKAKKECKDTPALVVQEAKKAMAVHVQAMLEFHKQGISTF